MSNLTKGLHEEIEAENWCTRFSKRDPFVFNPAGEIVRERAMEKRGSQILQGLGASSKELGVLA